MAVNKYFNNFGYKREQNLVEDLIVESIKHKDEFHDIPGDWFEGPF